MSPSDMPDGPVILPDLQRTMETALVMNERGQIWLLHNKQFPAVLNWAEYDAEKKSLTFISHDGRLIDMGVTVQSQFHDSLMKSRNISTMLLHDGQVCDFYILPLVSRQGAPDRQKRKTRS